MGAVEKISRAYKRDKEMRVRQEAHKRNQFRLMPFRVFLSKRNKLGLGKKIRTTKSVSEEIDGSFQNEQISDAICCYMASNADADEKLIVTNELATKVMAMSQASDVILLAISIETLAAISARSAWFVL